MVYVTLNASNVVHNEKTTHMKGSKKGKEILNKTWLNLTLFNNYVSEPLLNMISIN